MYIIAGYFFSVRMKAECYLSIKIIALFSPLFERPLIACLLVCVCVFVDEMKTNKIKEGKKTKDCVFLISSTYPGGKYYRRLSTGVPRA